MESENINLILPIKIRYPVLQQLIDKKLIGMELGSGNRKHGKIVGTSLEPSPLPGYDIVLGLRIEFTRKIVFSKETSIFIHGSLDYEPETGRISIDTFKIDSKSRNFLLDKTLQILANRIYYRKVLDKATYNLNELLGPQLSGLNEMLRSGMPFSQGMVLHANLENITISGIEPLADYVLVHALFKGGAEVIVHKLPGTNLKL